MFSWQMLVTCYICTIVQNHEKQSSVISAQSEQHKVTANLL